MIMFTKIQLENTHCIQIVNLWNPLQAVY